MSSLLSEGAATVAEVSTRVEVWVTEDERWPEYLLGAESRHYSTRLEVDAETLERWKAATATFDAAQDEIAAALEAARENDSSPAQPEG